MLLEPYVRFHIFSYMYVRVAEWPPIGIKLFTRLTIYYHGIST